MRPKLTCTFILLLTCTGAFAQNPAPESAMAQAMLAEIRQLRSDLQTTATTVQRIQIVMYRLQSEAVVLERATQRVEQARSICNRSQSQRKLLTAQIERAEARRRNAQNAAEQKEMDEAINNLRSSAEMWNTEEQQCQIELADAEAQSRAEQAKMSDLQERLDKLDRSLAQSGLR
jgi:hypothetical protein